MRWINLLFFGLYMILLFIPIQDIIWQLGIHNPNVIKGSIWANHIHNTIILDIMLIIGCMWSSFWSLKKIVDPENYISFSNNQKEAKMRILK